MILTWFREFSLEKTIAPSDIGETVLLEFAENKHKNMICSSSTTTCCSQCLVNACEWYKISIEVIQHRDLCVYFPASKNVLPPQRQGSKSSVVAPKWQGCLR